MNHPTTSTTIIYGGSFNPPTIAHEAILVKCVEHAIGWGADIWVVPSGNRRDKRIPVDRQVRLDYIDAMLHDVDLRGVSVKVVTNELDRNMHVETYDTAIELAAKYPDNSFVWVFGADSAVTMGDWLEGEWLRQNLRMLIVERNGIHIEPTANMTFINIGMPDVSSTEVRRRIEKGEPVDRLVGPRVGKIVSAT